MVEIVNFPFHKLKVVNVVRYLEEVILVIFRIKRRARRLQVILVSVIQRRMKGRGRGGHRGASVSEVVICGTTQIPPPQNPVPPPTPVSVYLTRNAQKSMGMNQILQPVSAALQYVIQLLD